MVKLLVAGAGAGAVNFREMPQALSAAARIGHEAIFRLLVEEIAVLDSEDIDKALNLEGTDRGMVLSAAAAYGLGSVVKLILDRGAARDLRDRHGHTPLLGAAENRHEAVVKLLLDEVVALFTPNSRNGYGRTLLLGVAEKGYEAVIKLLVKYEAKQDIRDKHGRTALWWATIYGHKAVVKLLVDQGALNLEDTDHWKELFAAAGYRDMGTAKLLMGGLGLGLEA